MMVLYGYSSVGEAVYQELLRRGQTVDCFCDDSIIKIANAKCDVPIYTFDQLLEKETNCKFIICIPNAEPIIKKIEKNGFEWKLALEFLIREHYEKFTYTIKNKSMAIREVESCEFYHKGLEQPEKIYLRNIDLEITEKCSLRCYNCCNLIQYYEKPRNYSVDELISDVQVLLKYVEEIYEVRILGGEPFMHNQIKEILDALKQIPQIKRILLLSNGTIIPDEAVFQTMQSEKIGISFTDYGELSRNLNIFCEKLHEMNIAYDVHEMGGWTLCSEIEKQNRNIEELKKVYDNCCAKNLYTILNGRLYKCPFIANGINLKAIPNNKDDVIDLRTLKLTAEDAAMKILRQFIREKKWFASCDYCLGRDFDAPEIEPAVQTLFPRQYRLCGDE